MDVRDRSNRHHSSGIIQLLAEGKVGLYLRKGNEITQLEFEHAYNDIAVHHDSNFITKIPPETVRKMTDFNS